MTTWGRYVYPVQVGEFGPYIVFGGGECQEKGGEYSLY